MGAGLREHPILATETSGAAALAESWLIASGDECPRVVSLLVGRAEVLLASRRQRTKFFPGHNELFGEPAWDMMLDLYVQLGRKQTTSITSLALASGVPETTAKRWMGRLEECGLIVLKPHPSDRRCRLAWLTESAVHALTAYLDTTGEMAL